MDINLAAFTHLAVQREVLSHVRLRHHFQSVLVHA